MRPWSERWNFAQSISICETDGGPRDLWEGFAATAPAGKFAGNDGRTREAFVSLDYRAFAAFLVLSLAAPAAADTAPDPDAMTFHAWSSNEGLYFGQGVRSYIFAAGDITPDTPKVFQEFLQNNPPKDPHTTVVFDSPGGNLAAGLELGKLIRKAKLDTAVGARLPINIGVSPNVPSKIVRFLSRRVSPPFLGGCYSACTFAFLGGVHRSVPYASTYGVHRFEFVNPPSGTDFADAAQQMSGELVQYVDSMGVEPELITEMSKKGPKEMNNLSSRRLAELNVVTPRWQTSWQIATFNDSSGFYLQGTTTDQWGEHEVAVLCPTKTAQAPSPVSPSPVSPSPVSPSPVSPSPVSPSSGGLTQKAGPGQAQPAPPAQPPHQGGLYERNASPNPVAAALASATAPALELTFYLEPGSRTAVDKLPGAVEHYALELDQGTLVADDLITSPAAISSKSKRLTATVTISRKLLTALEGSDHIGFAFVFKKSADFPIRILQFESDLDTAQLKNFQSTCH
jgi:hypothetical protein